MHSFRFSRRFMFSVVAFCLLVCLATDPRGVWADGIRSFEHQQDQTVEVDQWEVCDIRLKTSGPVAAPFELDVTAQFTGPDQQTLTIPAFYDGDQTWVIRFSAPQPGQWNFKTGSTHKDLNDLRGQLQVTANQDPAKHGGLTLDADNPRHFYYEDKTPCSVLAFEADWLFALDYDNPDGTPKTKQLLKSLRAGGINQVVTTVYSYDVQWDKDPLLAKYPQYELGGRNDIYPFLGSNQKPDFSSLNIKFFRNMDRMVEQLDRHQITAHLMIYVWNKKVNWPPAESAADNRYFDYLIKRYQAFPNVLWDVSKEALNNARCSESYAVERISRIRKLDAYDRLITVHDGGFCQRHHEVVDFISWQMWSATIYSDMLKVIQRFPSKPVFNIEHGGYEKSPFVVFPGDYDDPEVCLKRNYLIMFAGVYSTYYWQGAAWHVLIHDPFDQPDFDSPRFDYYGHLQEFFTRYPYAEFQPAPKDNRSAYCLKNKDSSTYLVYVPKEHYQVSCYGAKGFSKPGATDTIWFNTRTGEYKRTEVQFDKGMFFESPWKGEADSILIRLF